MISSAWPELVNNEDAERFIDLEKNLVPFANYKVFSEHAHNTLSAIRLRHGAGELFALSLDLYCLRV